MVNIKYGNILDATENMICHQCNTEGVFGGGLACQIKEKYPVCELSAQSFVSYFGLPDLLGMINYCQIGEDKVICNCFTQNEDYSTNYEALEKACTEIFAICSKLNWSVAFPFKYGCGIAHGDWSIVLDIISRCASSFGLDVSIYCLKENDLNG